jgi:ribosomal protein L18
VLNLTLGFSHPVAYEVPEGITIETPSQTEVLVKGIDRQKVGQVAAEIRGYRPPEPYKGKGVRYSGRARGPEGSEEEVGRARHGKESCTHSARAPRPVQDPGAGLQPSQRPPHAAAHLRADHLAGRRKVLAAASTVQPAGARGTGEDRQYRSRPAVGRAIAEAAKAAGVSKVAFDRSAFRYHGRVKALADAAREHGLEF